MTSGRHSYLQKVRFYSSVVVLNAATLFFMSYIFQPFGLMRPASPVFAKVVAAPAQSEPKIPVRVPITGKPTRIQIIQSDNGLNVDLPVKDGFYDEIKQTWTLDEQNTFFAVPSVLANDTAGATMIYGHNKAEVFGYLSALHQGVGTYALIHTDTGKVFRYTYQDATDLKPTDTSVFTADGPPTLLVQTCSGSWFELRRIYRFTFEKVEVPV